MAGIDLSKTVLGLELGSTRIKAVILNEAHKELASGSFEWENRLENGLWTYSLESAEHGLQTCYAALKSDFEARYGQKLTSLGAIGISGMMHGYLPFNKEGRQLAKFRTWRNTCTGAAAAELSERFDFNIPQRWSIAHLYQAILNGEEHIGEIDFIVTLAGYIHWRLTGLRVIGLGEASGMFPIDSETLDYDAGMVSSFNELLLERGIGWRILDVLPEVLPAGSPAGALTEAGALLLDPTGQLESGIALAPCEGDAGTGMVATNSVSENTGNVSAGTSGFAMLVTDHKLGVHKEVDMVTTPAGLPVAMVHCNNCTTDINAWAGLFEELLTSLGLTVDKGELFAILFRKALEGAPDCGGLLSYNYFSGEGITALDQGRPIFARTSSCDFSLANFMRTHLFSALATLKLGIDILTDTEGVRISGINGHGGFFKTPEVGQRMLSAAIETPVSVMKTAGEGGPYGMALLAAYMLWHNDNEALADYLKDRVFNEVEVSTVMAADEDIKGFNEFMSRYKAAFSLESTAVMTLP